MRQAKKGASAHTLKEAIQQDLKELRVLHHQDIWALGLVLLIGIFIGLLFRRRRSGKNISRNIYARRWFLSNKRITENGYVVRKSNSGHDQYEHREIAEEILGRRLEADEVVHHINGRPSDNRPSNLCVMTRLDHDRYHKWYDWIYKTYGNYPRRETQLQKLKESFNGNLLADIVNKRTGAG